MASGLMPCQVSPQICAGHDGAVPRAGVQAACAPRVTVQGACEGSRKPLEGSVFTQVTRWLVGCCAAAI